MKDSNQARANGNVPSPEEAVPAVHTAKQQRGRPFPKGTSGNPAGRKKGSRNLSTLALQALLDDEGEKITRVAITKALDGDMTALRLCLERLLPPAKERLVQVTLAPLESVNDIAMLLAQLIGLVASGELTPGEAQSIAGLMETYRRAVETVEFERRLSLLEGKSPEPEQSTRERGQN